MCGSPRFTFRPILAAALQNTDHRLLVSRSFGVWARRIRVTDSRVAPHKVNLSAINHLWAHRVQNPSPNETKNASNLPVHNTKTQPPLKVGVCIPGSCLSAMRVATLPVSIRSRSRLVTDDWWWWWWCVDLRSITRDGASITRDGALAVVVRSFP